MSTENQDLRAPDPAPDRYVEPTPEENALFDFYGRRNLLFSLYFFGVILLLGVLFLAYGCQPAHP